MISRLYKWIIYDVIMGVTPVAMAILFRYLANGDAQLDGQVPEVLFGVIVLNVTAIREITEVTSNKFKSTFRFLIPVLIIASIIAAIVYGGIIGIKAIKPSHEVVALIRASFIMLLVFFIMALITQVMIEKAGRAP
jgi:hypothetical protein